MTPSDQFAARWIEAGDLFMAAYFHALASPCGPATEAILNEMVAIGVRLSREDFAAADQWETMQSLSGYAERDESPPKCPVHSGEICAAGIVNHYKILKEYARRAATARGLRKQYLSIMEDRVIHAA